METLKNLNKSWICNKCLKLWKAIPANERSASPAKANTPAVATPPEPSPSTEPSLATLMASLTSLAAEIGLFKKHLKPEEIGNDLKGIKDALDIQGEYSARANERLSEIERQLKKQGDSFDALLLENNNLKAKIGKLEVRLNHAEQDLKANSLEIRGIPVRAGDTPDALVTSIATGLGITLGSNLDYAVRLRPKAGDPRPPVIIARFVKQSVRDEFIKQRSVRRNFSTRSIGWQEIDDHPIYLSEDMTPTNRHLYYLARQLKTAKKIKYVWFTGGRVRCRRDDGCPQVIINTPQDLDVFQ